MIPVLIPLLVTVIVEIIIPPRLLRCQPAPTTVREQVGVAPYSMQWQQGIVDKFNMGFLCTATLENMGAIRIQSRRLLDSLQIISKTVANGIAAVEERCGHCIHRTDNGSDVKQQTNKLQTIATDNTVLTHRVDFTICTINVLLILSSVSSQQSCNTRIV